MSTLKSNGNPNLIFLSFTCQNQSGRFRGQQQDETGPADCKDSYQQGEYITDERDTSAVIASDEKETTVHPPGEGELLVFNISPHIVAVYLLKMQLHLHLRSIQSQCFPEPLEVASRSPEMHFNASCRGVLIH